MLLICTDVYLRILGTFSNSFMVKTQLIMKPLLILLVPTLIQVASAQQGGTVKQGCNIDVRPVCNLSIDICRLEPSGNNIVRPLRGQIVFTCITLRPAEVQWLINGSALETLDIPDICTQNT